MTIRNLAVTVLLLAGVAPAASQTAPTFQLSGLAFLDYSYVLQEPNGSAGDNGFGYRRLYLTSDFRLNSDMRVRARLEANDGTTNSDGNPSPFVKDLFLRWDNAVGEGHRLTVGISSPPAFTASEAFLGYRSLEKTIQDLKKIVSSRDFGLKMEGPLGSGGLTYAVMLGNNSSVKQETDRHKRLYVQVGATPGDRLALTIGGDYASLPGGSSLNTNAFLGYRLDRARIGVEGFYNPVRPEDRLDELDRSGVSVFGAFSVGGRSELVTRFDAYNWAPALGQDLTGWFALVGVAMRPADGVQIIPNLVLDNAIGTDDTRITGRVTLNLNF